MPVRFRCDECGQLLSIARRKGGSHINCPRCRNDLLVPKVDADLEVAVPHRLFEEDSFDKILGRKGTTTTASRPVSRAVLDRPMTETGADATDSPLERDDDFPYKSARTSKSTISAPKRSGYWLEGLTIASILGSFGLGLALADMHFPITVQRPSPSELSSIIRRPSRRGGDGIAQGDNQKPVDAPAKKEAAPAKPVCKLGGTVFFANEEKRTPDVGAVVILLPTKLEPGRRIKVDGLRPNDPDSNDQVGVADVARYGEVSRGWLLMAASMPPQISRANSAC